MVLLIGKRGPAIKDAGRDNERGDDVSGGNRVHSQESATAATSGETRETVTNQFETRTLNYVTPFRNQTRYKDMNCQKCVIIIRMNIVPHKIYENQNK